MIALILMVSPQFSYAQDVRDTPQASVATSNVEETDPQEMDEDDGVQIDDASHPQAIEGQKKSTITHKKPNLIANSNGDAIQDTGDDEEGD